MESQLESALREAVRDVLNSGELGNLTVKRIRKHVETELGLEEDFFKTDDEWKEKSKTVIQSEVDANDELHKSSQVQPPSPKATEEYSKLPPKAAPKVPSRGTKRASTEFTEPKPKKRNKKSEQELDGTLHVKERAATTRPRAKLEPEPRLSPEPGTDEEAEAHEAKGELDNGNAKEVHSESEMSVVLDKDPKPKKKRRRKSEPKLRAKKTEDAKGKRPSDGPADPDAEEIKRLQGWLVKCGLRKMWYKELAPYDTAKAKIKHLKAMLADAGMDGRYSKEKADQIREQRELKADLEAVQAGAKAWGTDERVEKQADGKEGSRPRRRLAIGLQGLDFLNDDDGEETD